MITKAKIKHIRSLQKSKERYTHNQYIIEGWRLVQEILKSNHELLEVYFTSEFKERHPNIVADTIKKCPLALEISQAEMQSISATETPSGILGICKISTGNQSDDKLDDNWLYLDNISDPGNMGTLLRTAVWFGIHNIAFSRGCVDIFNPKVVRSGMGAHFHISYILDANITQFNSTHTLYGGDQDGKSLDDFDIETPWILVLGNEAHGISQGIRKTIHRYIAIPRLGAGESLNVAVAGGIIMEKLVKK